MAIFSFTHPQYLFFLFVIPLLFLIHFFSLGNRKKVALKFANFDAISRIKGVDFFSKNVISLFLNSLIVLLMVLAISGLTVQVFKEASSFSFVIAMDSSQSMEADDFYPNRAEVAKEIARDFVDQAPRGVDIGVVSFSGNSYLEQDLTQDKIEIKNSINKVKIDGWGGTDLFEALISATNMLRDKEFKAVIILSDGQINIGKLDDIIEYAQRNDVILHSIAVGTKEGGNTPYAISKLDEESLQSLSYNTGGEYSIAESKEQLSKSFLDILNLTEKKVSLKLFNYLIILAILLFALEFFLVNTRYLNIL